jgi:hypothetical protein
LSCRNFGALALFSQKLGAENVEKKIGFSPVQRWERAGGFFSHFSRTRAMIPYKMAFLDLPFFLKVRKKKKEGIFCIIIDTAAVNSPVSNNKYYTE